MNSYVLFVSVNGQINELRRNPPMPQTPNAVKYKMLAMKVDELEANAAKREAHLKQVMELARERSKLEMARVVDMHREETDQKDRQLAHFREELDDMMAVVASFIEANPACKRQVAEAMEQDPSPGALVGARARGGGSAVATTVAVAPVGVGGE